MKQSSCSVLLVSEFLGLASCLRAYLKPRLTTVHLVQDRQTFFLHKQKSLPRSEVRLIADSCATADKNMAC